MEWGDELEAGARALLGEDYDQTVGKIRAERRQFAEQQPGLSTAATASGFAMPFFPKQRIPGTGVSFSPAKLADPAGEALIAGTGKLGLNYRAGQPAVENIPRTAAQGAMVAGPAGLTTAAGMSEPGDEGSPLGAGIISTIGGSLVNPGMSAMMGKAMPYVQDAMSNEYVQKFVNPLFGGGQPPIPPGGAAGAASPPEPPRMGLGDPELETALRRMKDDGLTVAQMKARQQEAKDLGYTNTIYPDLGEEGVLKQTRAIVNKSPEAATLADQFLRPRQEQMASRIGQRSDEMIAPGVSDFEQKQAQQVIRDTEAPMMNIIREDPVDAQALADAVNRRDEVRAQFEKSREINQGFRPEDRLPDFQGDLENQVTVPLQSAEFARQGIDVLQDRITKDPSALDKRLSGLYSNIKEDVYTAANHPVYRELMKTRENTYKIEEAAVAGAEAFSGKSASEIELQMSMLAPDELAAYKAAFVSALKNQINRVARGTNVSRKLNNQNVEDQLRALFQGDGEAFKRYYDGVRTQETRMARTYGQVKGNSTTASQLDEMNSLGKVQDVFDALGVAAYPAPTRENFGTLTRLLSRATDPSEKIAKNLGEVYFNPSRTDDFLDLLDRYSTRRDELMQILARQSGRPLSFSTRSLLSGDE